MIAVAIALLVCAACPASVSVRPDRLGESRTTRDSADDRELWVRVGMAVKSAIADDGFALWDEWSRKSTSYREQDALAVWRSIRPDGGVTLGTLFHEAGKNGYIRCDPASRSHPSVTNVKPTLSPKEDPGVISPAQHCNSATVAAYAAWKKLPEDFLRSLDLTDIRYHGQRALRIPYRDRTGAETAVRIRRFLDKSQDHDRRFLWRRGDKPKLYGLERLGHTEFRLSGTGNSTENPR